MLSPISGSGLHLCDASGTIQVRGHLVFVLLALAPSGNDLRGLAPIPPAGPLALPLPQGPLTGVPLSLQTSVHHSPNSQFSSLVQTFLLPSGSATHLPTCVSPGCLQAPQDSRQELSFHLPPSFCPLATSAPLQETMRLQHTCCDDLLRNSQSNQQVGPWAGGTAFQQGCFLTPPL